MFANRHYYVKIFYIRYNCDFLNTAHSSRSCYSLIYAFNYLWWHFYGVGTLFSFALLRFGYYMHNQFSIQQNYVYGWHCYTVLSSFLSQLESIPSSHLARFTIVRVSGRRHTRSHTHLIVFPVSFSTFLIVQKRLTD